MTICLSKKANVVRPGDILHSIDYGDAGMKVTNVDKTTSVGYVIISAVPTGKTTPVVKYKMPATAEVVVHQKPMA